MKLTVFLPSHNKGGFAVEAVRSVTGQDYPDWELQVLENSTDDGRTRSLLRKFADLADPRVVYREIDVPQEIRRQYVACPWLLNRYYPQAGGDVILYLSDDDLFMPGLFSEVAAHFTAHPEHDALYFHLARVTAKTPGEGRNWDGNWHEAGAHVPRGAGQLDCIIDGGQVAYRKSVLDLIRPLYFYDGKDTGRACHADGLHLEDIARAGITFYPLPVKGVIHRHTPGSVWSRI